MMYETCLLRDRLAAQIVANSAPSLTRFKMTDGEIRRRLKAVRRWLSRRAV